MNDSFAPLLASLSGGYACAIGFASVLTLFAFALRLVMRISNPTIAFSRLSM